MKSIWFNFLERSRVTFLLIFAVLIVGVFALLNVDIESNPEINQPIGIVQTFYPNASAIDVEQNVTKELEKEFQSLDRLDSITSSSRSNLSSITVQFETSADVDEVIADLTEAANKVAARLPDGAEDSEVLKLDFNAISIVSLSVVGDKDFKDLSEVASDVADEIEGISGVSNVEMIGDYDEEVTIILDRLVAEYYGITTGQIIQAIQVGSLNLPVGEINRGNSNINLRVKGEVATVEMIKNLPLSNLSDGNDFKQLTIGDIAYVAIEPVKQDTLSFVSEGDGDAKRAVTLNVFKSSGGNIVDIVNEVDEKVLELDQNLEEGIRIIKTNDNAYFIKNDLSTLSSSGVQTIFVIFIAILLVLSVKEALVASIAIPLIFLITFGVLYGLDETLNGLTIFSLILSLGLIVDTSVVIVEGIYEFKKEGKSSLEAAKETLSQYKWPLVAGTLTTLSAFAPMLLVSGIVGEYIRTIPIVLSITLGASLLVSFAITPLLSVKLIDLFERFSRKNSDEKKLSLKEKFLEKIKDGYEKNLRLVLSSRVARAGILVVTLVCFVASMTLPITGILKAELFPEADTPFTYINFEAEVGTQLDDTREMASVIEDVLNEKEYVKNYTVNFGSNISTDPSGGSSESGDYLGHFVVNLTDESSGRDKSYVISDELREELEMIDSELDITVESISAGPPAAAPIEIRLSGPGLDNLQNFAELIKNEIGEVDGLINIRSDFDNNNSELELVLDEDRLSYYGLNKQSVAQTLQSLVNGAEAGEIQIEGEATVVRVWLDSNDTKSFAEVLNTSIPTQVGFIPLSELGGVSENDSLQVIPRIDQERTVRVRANLEEGVIVTEVLPLVEEKLEQIELPSGYKVEIGGEDEEIQESFADLFSSMIVAVILILIILVAQFNSIRQTFIILCTLPLAVIGIFPGLSLLGLPLSFPAFLGVVMLTGIVVNDAIVMVDQINRNRIEAGMELKEAIVTACRLRFVPIMLTTITTVFGLLPITISDEFWRGLGFSVIFGLTTATFLTLMIIPILFTIFLRDKKSSEIVEENENLNTSDEYISPRQIA